MKKRIISLFLVICLFVSMLSFEITAEDVSDTASGSSNELLWNYEVCDGGVVLTAYLGSATDVYVPDYIEDDGTEYKVVKLGDGVFENNDGLNSVTLGDGITEIGARTFYDADNMVCIVTTENLSVIGDEAFFSCDNFNSIILYDNISSIGNNAFSECPLITIWCNENSVGYNYAVDNNIAYEIMNSDAQPEIITSEGITYYIMNGEAYAVDYDESSTVVTVPSTVNNYPVTELRETFSSCKSLVQVNLPDGLKQIGKNAFNGCSKLESITIPASVVYIGFQAFTGCDTITEIIVPQSVKYIGNYAFCTSDALERVIIPDSVTTLGSHLFSYCINLKEVRLPDGIQSIGTLTFQACRSLQQVTIPETVTHIGSSAFKECTALTNIKLPSALTMISSNAFQNCTALAEVVIPEGVATIGSNAFSGCDALQKVIVPQSVSSMTTSSFSAKTLLMVYEESYAHSFAVSNNLLYYVYDGINEPAFYTVDGVTYYVANDAAIAIDCDKTLTEVVVPESVAGYPVVELYSTFKDCTALKKVTLPEGLEKIGTYAFYGCTSLSEVNIPESVTELGSYAFYKCTGITNATIPVGMTTIPEYCFAYCSGITSLSIPSGVTTIGKYAFYYCSGITELDICEGVTTINNDAFFGCSSLTEIALPDSVTSVGSEVFANCYNLVSAVLSTGMTAIPGELFRGCSKLTDVTIPDSITRISYQAFYNCTSLKMIAIPDNVSTISGIYDDGNTFVLGTVLLVKEGTAALDAAKASGWLYCIWDGITAPAFHTIDGITYCIIDNAAIAVDCDSSVTEIAMPEYVDGYPVTELWGTFRYCYSLTSVTLPSSLTFMSKDAFYSTAITELDIPDGVTSIEESTFMYCDELTRVELPDSLESIGKYAFYCAGLTELNLPANLKTIGAHAFFGCSITGDVVVPDGTTTILSEAFYTPIRTILIPESVTNMYAGAFKSNTVLIVYEDSYAHKVAVNNNLLYFILQKTENPEISFGTGITGTVTYSDGTVAQNATVEILYDDGTVKETVKTSDTGVYEFTYAEVGRYTIKATDASGYTASTSVSVKRMNAFDVFMAGDTDITLKLGYSISGTVSENVAKVTITDEQGNTIVSTETTDGTFNFTNISNGTYIIKAETESSTVSQEITVFEADIADVVLSFTSDTADIWGYVEVEDRDFNHHRRNWVEVTLYNDEGIAVDKTKSDGEGKYYFSNLPLGEYTIVAETNEMRPDRKHRYSRSHTLTGFAYINAELADIYQAETIVLYEENDYLATISGKVTAHGESQICDVTLKNVFRHEIDSITTGKNGKYSFKNVRDGMYIITAITENDGMGYTVVVVRGGKVYGNTDITIYKSDKIKDREDRFTNEVPECNSREDAVKYRERIAEEKRFYDGLSAKEKKQLSKIYIDRLNKLSEWIANCEYTTDEGVSVEQGGLVLSGDELENGNEVSFTIKVESRDKWDTNTDGVKTEQDFIQHSMEDTAQDREIKQYYEITMSKTVDGQEKEITSVYKDTDSMGKFRVTMDIPEEYRGHKHYSIIHVHHGETVILTDLDDNPDTITFEVDKFSTFALTTSDDVFGEAVEDDRAELNFTSASLSLHNSITVSFKVAESLFTEGGYTNPYVKFVFNDKEYIVSDYEVSGGNYIFDFTGVAPNRMNDVIYATVYATWNGTEYVSETKEYSVRKYCDNMLTQCSDDSYASLRTLLVDLLNYGAQSQIYSGYNTDNLANAGLSETQKSWGTASDPVLSNDKGTVNTLESAAVTWRSAGLNLTDAVVMRFRITAESIEGLSVQVATADGKASWSIPASEFVENTKEEGGYYVFFDNLNVANMRTVVYLTVYNGDVPVSNTISYSIQSYAASNLNSEDTNLSELVKAMIKYGDAAAAYVASCE